MVKPVIPLFRGAFDEPAKLALDYGVVYKRTIADYIKPVFISRG
jgi:hypothetical protein